jgi:two-component system nitrate/nitrite response regulator NarL
MVAPLPQASDLKVLVIGDDPLARAGLAGLLAAEPGISVTGHYASGFDRMPQHDVVAWDCGVGGAGLERLRERARETPAVAMVASDESAGDAFLAGARGVLPRESEPARLAAALRAAAEGLLVMDPAYQRSLLPTRAPSGPDVLSPRELEVLQLMAEGHPNKIIADKLKISEHTAKFHVNAIFARLGVQSRTEAVVRAVRQGILAL